MQGPIYPHMQMPYYQQYRQMQMQAFPFSFGHSAIDQIAMMKFGNQLAPRPQPGTTQGLLDAADMRQQTMDFRTAQMNALATSMPLARLGGVDQQSAAFQVLGSMMGDPDGAAANFLAPLIGGNPMKAQMGMLANLNTQAMSTFGRMGRISLPETSRMMDSLNHFAYDYRPRTAADLTTGRAEMISAAKRKNEQAAPGTGMPSLDSRINDLFEAGSDRIDVTKYDIAKGQNRNLTNLQEKLSKTNNEQEIQDIKRAMIDAFTDPNTKTAIANAFAAGAGKGDKTSSEVEKVLQIKTMNQMLTGAVAGQIHDQNNIGKMLPSGINYGNTMGIQLQDFSSAFTSAASMKLFNKNDTFEKFLGTGNAGGVLDSLKGVFGNDRNGSELMEGLNDILGSSHISMASKDQTAAVESMLRNLKALSRNTDISVEAMVGLIKTANQAASQTTGLQYMGGMQTAPMVMRAVENANAITMVASNDYVRRAGGLPQIINEQLKAQMQSANQPITKQVAAMYHLAERTGGAAGERAKAMIEAYRTGGTGYNAAGFGNLASQVGRALGLAPSQMLQYSQNTEAQALGMRANPELSSIGEGAVNARFMRMANQVGRMHGMGNRYGSTVLNRLRGKAGPDGELDPSLLLTDPILSQNKELLAFMQQNQTVLANYAMRNHPKIKEAKREEKERRAVQLVMEKNLTAKFGHLNAPAGQALLNQLFTSGASAATFDQLMKPILGDRPQVAGLKELANNATDIHTSRDFGSMMAKIQYQNADGTAVSAVEKTANDEVMQEYAGGGIIQKLAKAGGKTEQELLRVLAGQSESERNAYIDQLSQAGGFSGAAANAFKTRDHQKDLERLSNIGMGGVKNFSDFKETQAALGAHRKTQFMERAIGQEIDKVNNAFTRSVSNVEGQDSLRTAMGLQAGGKMDAREAQKVLQENYDPRDDVTGKVGEQRKKFVEEAAKKLGIVKKEATTDANGNAIAAESDEQFATRVRSDPKFAALQRKTSQSATQAQQVRTAAGLDKPEVKAAEALTTQMQQLIKFLEGLPAMLDKLGQTITDAASP